MKLFFYLFRHIYGTLHAIQSYSVVCRVRREYEILDLGDNKTSTTAKLPPKRCVFSSTLNKIGVGKWLRVHKTSPRLERFLSDWPLEACHSQERLTQSHECYGDGHVQTKVPQVNNVINSGSFAFHITIGDGQAAITSIMSNITIRCENVAKTLPSMTLPLLSFKMEQMENISCLYLRSLTQYIFAPGPEHRKYCKNETKQKKTFG